MKNETFSESLYLYKDTAAAQRMCDAGTDHYCSKTCNKCGQYTDSQNLVMLVGGRKNGDEYYLNPSFFSLNGSSLPACLDSTKNDIHPSLSKTRTPALFTNQGETILLLFWLKKPQIVWHDFFSWQSGDVCWTSWLRWMLRVWGWAIHPIIYRE